MRGFYKVYENGKCVGGGPNTITDAGKRVIADYLAGNAPSWAGAIALGSGVTSPTTADERLQFEYYRSAVNSRSVTYDGVTAGTHLITIKSYVDPSISGTITELGLFSEESDSVAGAGAGILLSYGDSLEPWSEYSSGWIPITTTPDTTNVRIGLDSVALTAGNFRLPGAFDLSAYSGLDDVQFCFQNLTGTISALVLRFNTDDSNYFTYSPSLGAFASGTSYTISAHQLSSWTAVGTPSWADITSFEIQLTGTNTSILDGIRVSDTDTNNPAYAMVSRAVLTVPIVKSAGSNMEIEYYVEY